MDIIFKTGKLARIFNDHKNLVREFGPEQAAMIEKRLAELAAADNLQVVRTLPQARAHELAGNRQGQISLDLRHPYRLLITPNHEEMPQKEDGGLDWSRVTSVMVLGVEDTHG
jgi:plasmid maintenance system killer protein